MGVLYREYVDALKMDEDVAETCKKFYRELRRTFQGPIYKYYSLNNGNPELNGQKLECLQKEQIYISCRDEFNDPYDDKGYIYNRNIVEKYAVKLGLKWQLEDIYPDFKRFSCLTKSGINNISMWAHYANNHQGYCIEYAEKNNYALYAMLLPVEYVEAKIDLTDMICSRLKMVIDKNEPKLLEEALEWCSIFLSCIKHTSWKNEEEIRYCCPKDFPGVPYIKAKPSKIYIGSKCCKEYENRLVQISEILNVPVYKMKLDTQDVEYALKPQRICSIVP